VGSPEGSREGMARVVTAVIGLHGEAGVGKDWIADQLVEKHGFVKLSFAAPLKEAVRALNPIVSYGGRVVRLDEALAEGEAHVKAYYPEYRRLLEVFGTEVARDMFGEDVWVKQMEETIRNIWLDRDARIVISDVRFPNEAEWIRRHVGGKVVRVSGVSSGLDSDGHASRKSLADDLVDAAFVNDRDVDGFSDFLAVLELIGVDYA